MRTLRTMIAAVALAAVALLVLPATANAAQGQSSLSGWARSSSVILGATASAAVSLGIFDDNDDYNPSGIIRPAVTSTGTVVADATGTIRFRITVTPDTYSGPVELTMTGIGADGLPRTVSETVQITASVTGGSGLPATGVDAASTAGIWVGGGVLLLGGLVVTVVAARRKSASQVR
jgi:LPXTG-motif cell wall-anchored protein